MKRVLKTIGFAGLLVLYCFTVSFYSGPVSGQGAGLVRASHITASEGSRESVSTNSFYHNTSTEHTLSIRTPAVPSSFKSRFTDAAVLHAAPLHLNGPGIVQYIFISRHHIPRLRSCDIIFPFHYFW